VASSVIEKVSQYGVRFVGLVAVLSPLLFIWMKDKLDTGFRVAVVVVCAILIAPTYVIIVSTAKPWALRLRAFPLVLHIRVPPDADGTGETGA